MPRALVVGHDSELGRIASAHLKSIGWNVFGTSRRIENLIDGEIFFCDFSNRSTIDHACQGFFSACNEIDLVISCIGQLSPIGPFSEVDFEEWASSIESNFVNQIYLIRQLLKGLVSKDVSGTKFLTFAGSGTNSAPTNFSAYTLSKIALIKSMELLSVEYPDFFFLSLGTGWMKSAIHNQTLLAGPSIGNAYSETIRRLNENDFGSPLLLCEFLDWYISITDLKFSGRNIALQGDNWKEAEFVMRLAKSENSFKLRRSLS